MNYNLIKIGYRLLATVILILCIFTLIFFDKVNEVVSANLMLIISASLCLPFFLLKFIHEQKHPPSKTKKIIGYMIGVLTIILCMFIDRIL
jgi:hypothetical protein